MVRRVSVNNDGIPGDKTSGFSTISSDGRYIAFQSSATNLVASDTNSSTDIFVRDTLTQTTTRISVDSSGAEGDNGGTFPIISADGRFVSFLSGSTNLVAGDTNNHVDLFVRDLQANTTTRLPIDANTFNNLFDNLDVSADGRYLVFKSENPNLVAGDTNNRSDVFRFDKQTGTTIRISTDGSGAEGNHDSEDAAISADGRYVAFSSRASNLVAGDTNNSFDVFIRDTQTTLITRVSVDSNGVEGNFQAINPTVSGDGRYTAFESNSTNLVSGDTNSSSDIFVHDRQTGDTTRVSVDSSGREIRFINRCFNLF